SHGIIHKYEIGNWRGYSGKFSPSIVSTIQTYGEVDYIEQDKYVQSTSVQYYAPWGLARISSRKALDSNMHNRFIYSKDGGKNTTVYILDTGIYKIHKDFGGRVSLGKSFSNDPTDADLNGHGTHSAGIVGGHTYGVAKKDNLVSVKISDEFGNGTTSDAIAGIEWIVKNHIFNVQEDSLNNWRYKGAVGLLNFITYKSLALNNAASFQGISMVVPAGNSAYDACQYSPASATYAITVGASTYYDREASYSNYGDCVDIYAPGQNILSAWNTGTDAKHVLSGTSTAAAYIAGLAAYYTGNMKQQSIPEYIKKKILSTSTPDVI
ncbi:peptidase S8/S53 domain-containing protein, partial [Phycomyces nitens]